MTVLVDVSPRDGLQDEQVVLSPKVRAEFISRLAIAGFERIEAVSFVNPERVPQMAGAEEVIQQVPDKYRDCLSALVLNEKGLERADDSGIREVNYVIVATDDFSLKNQGFDTNESVDRWLNVQQKCEQLDIRATLTIGAAFGCPYSGEVNIDHLNSLLQKVVDSPPFEICLADTIGAAAPNDVLNKLDLVRDFLPDSLTRLHCHNSRNLGLANAYAAIVWGVDALDASTAGLGGCPFSVAATGNIPSEDLIYMLQRMGIENRVELSNLLEISSWVCEKLGRESSGMLQNVGLFPPTINSNS